MAQESRCVRCGNPATMGEPHCKKTDCGWIVCGNPLCKATFDPARNVGFHPGKDKGQPYHSEWPPTVPKQ